MQTVLLIIAVFAAVAAAVLGGVAVALALRSQRTHASELELARRAAESAQRAAVAMDAASSTLAQVNAVLAGLSQHAASTAAVDQERFDALTREFARANAKMDDVRREMQEQLGQNRDTVDTRLREMRVSVDRQLATIRQDNERQLERMRQTVDEKLQTTLETRLARSFKQVSDQLEAVYKGLGDMQGIAQGVGDLKRVLGNVKTRGMLGEVQLGAILAEILSPEQYVQNVATKPGSAERVEFAVRIPVEGAEPVLLPIDAKFPGDTYEHLREAVAVGDAEGITTARRQLEQRIRLEAKDISSKYISVPETTNFAIMFLPFEGLYAEVVDMPGMLESLQRDYQVSVAGPSTMAAILNSLQMSYQSFAFQRQADEILRVLSAVKAELPRYQAALRRAYDQINRAGSTVETLMTTRTRAIERKLRDVTALDDAHEVELVLGAAAVPQDDADEEPAVPYDTTQEEGDA
ncbi:DNA recombination protein RmuC [Collinsella tanakaei]|uniref:DNA recombination protein RmuC n=1 Tax=Collinsella tanakaei TaxID=626935 RepID=UPI0025A39908|nr:DNA recombination protein RmuC [Collinsella tanakaei]MDM8246353.1 DNA recombination protein RmuC [Collinsella tanakaei]